MNDGLYLILIFIMAMLLGYELIKKIPPTLHTPLMSGANAMSGVIVIGAIILMGKTDPTETFKLCLGTIAVILGTFNVVGGFAVTDRMLQMFKKKPKED